MFGSILRALSPKWTVWCVPPTGLSSSFGFSTSVTKLPVGTGCLGTITGTTIDKLLGELSRGRPRHILHKTLYIYNGLPFLKWCNSWSISFTLPDSTLLQNLHVTHFYITPFHIQQNSSSKKNATSFYSQAAPLQASGCRIKLNLKKLLEKWKSVLLATREVKTNFPRRPQYCHQNIKNAQNGYRRAHNATKKMTRRLSDGTKRCDC